MAHIYKRVRYEHITHPGQHPQHCILAPTAGLFLCWVLDRFCAGPGCDAKRIPPYKGPDLLSVIDVASRPDKLSGREATSGVTNKHIPVFFIVNPGNVSEIEHHNDVQLSTRSLLSLLNHHLLHRLLRRVFHIAGCL